jgi:hypothetical protein
VDKGAFQALTSVTGENNLEVIGLYVEDEDLYRAAQLPGMTEVSAQGHISALDLDEMGKQIADQAERARREFENFASRLKLNFSFRVARGRAIETLLKAAANSDLVVVTRSLRSSGLRTRQGAHFEPLVQEHANLLFINEPWQSGRSVVVLCELADGVCEKALQAAKRIADAESLELVIAVPPGRADVENPDVDRVVVLRDWAESAIVDLCESADARLLVLPPTENLDWRALLLNLVDRLSCSLLRLD